MVTLTALYIYPVKGFRGLALTEAEVEPWGLAQDRRWMVVDWRGRFITQRQVPRLALVEPRLRENGLQLWRAGHGSIEVAVPGPEADRIDVVVWDDWVAAVPAGAEADVWLSRALETPCRLVYMADPERARAVDPEFGRAGDHVSFADGFPMLVTTEASLADLNTRLDQAVPMDRFRTNLVVHGCEAWAEDEWRNIRVGDVSFRVVKDCARCAVTTVDQSSGEKSPENEPIRTLSRFRRKSGGRIIFGQNLVPDGPGVLRVGDPVSTWG